MSLFNLRRSDSPKLASLCWVNLQWVETERGGRQIHNPSTGNRESKMGLGWLYKRLWRYHIALDDLLKSIYPSHLPLCTGAAMFVRWRASFQCAGSVQQMPWPTESVAKCSVFMESTDAKENTPSTATQLCETPPQSGCEVCPCDRHRAGGCFSRGRDAG